MGMGKMKQDQLPDQLIEKVVVYFYLFFLDGEKTRLATLRAFRDWKNRPLKSNKNMSPDEIATYVVRLTRFAAEEKEIAVRKGLGSAGVQKKKSNQVHPLLDLIELPQGSNWGPWFEYSKQAEVQEYSTAIYGAILNLPDSVVAEQLNVTIGTVRHRVSKALLTLGEMVHV
jgi:hypothetical protein